MIARAWLEDGETLFSSRLKRSRCSGTQDAAKFGTFHVARRPAGSGVPQAVAHGSKPTDSFVQFIGLGCKHLPVNAEPPVRRKHERNLIQRESGGAPHGNQGKPLHHTGMKHTAQTPPADGGDQPLVFVKSQCRGRQAGALGHFVNVQIFFLLTSSRLELA